MTPFLASLFSLPIPDPDAERVRFLEAPMLRAGIFSQVAALVERLAGDQPLVLVLDDVHWIDPTSLDLLESLLPLTERASLLLIPTATPASACSRWTRPRPAIWLPTCCTWKTCPNGCAS